MKPKFPRVPLPRQRGGVHASKRNQARLEARVHDEFTDRMDEMDTVEKWQRWDEMKVVLLLLFKSWSNEALEWMMSETHPEAFIQSLAGEELDRRAIRRHKK